jgi:hypothetical protein
VELPQTSLVYAPDAQILKPKARHLWMNPVSLLTLVSGPSWVKAECQSLTTTPDLQENDPSYRAVCSAGRKISRNAKQPAECGYQ